MQEGLLTEILRWSEDRPGWQRDALRRLFTGGQIAPTDIEELLDLCKAAHGLSNPRAAQPLTKEHMAIKETTTAPVSLVSVTHHKGVNALAPEQTISFGPNLSIAYGQNATGKSGYTRILKRACRSRSSEEILGNVLSGEVPLKGQATIRFQVGAVEHSVTWMPDAAPSGALAAVSVFDSQCAPVYVRDKTDVAFRPFGLDLFDRLSAACSFLRERLEREQLALSINLPAIPGVAVGTKVSILLANLTSLTKSDDVRKLATFSDEEVGRLADLRERQRDLLASDPKKRSQELGLKASRLGILVTHVDRLIAVLGSAGLANLISAVVNLLAARGNLALLRTKVLTPGLLPGTGEEAWRKMWDASGEFSGIAYPKSPFPVVSHDAKCLLCQQSIDAEVIRRFQNFHEYSASNAQDEVRNAEAAYSSLTAAILQLVIAPDDVGNATEEIGTDHETLAKHVREFLKEAEEVQSLVRNAISQGKPLPTKGLTGNPGPELRQIALMLRDRAMMLRTQASTLSEKDTSELRELEARGVLREQLQAVLNEIERKRRIAAYGQCIEDTNTNAITRKSTELTIRLVTKKLQDEFKGELAKLEFTHLSVEIRSAGGAKGALFHQLVFKNAPGVIVARVLSEGESRTLSLAAFLAELSTASACSAIIFDDPVSSLDHVWRERIARRLVIAAKTRQVAVFTHDLLFLRFMLDECERQEVGCQHQYIRRDGQGSGICSPDLPWVAMRIKERLGVLRRRWQVAEKVFRTEGPQAYERDAREVYGLLREAWEQAVGEVLLYDVVGRYKHDIETKKLRYLHDITKEDCEAVEGGMSVCSRWMLGHDQPPADATPFPKPEDLDNLIKNLDEWVQRIRKRREGRGG